MDEHIKQALEIVKAQAGFRSMGEDEIGSMIKALASTIQEVVTQLGDAPGVPVVENPSGKITEKSITCLECGKSFKLLTRRHLGTHGLDLDSYREKWGYPEDLPLVCKSLQRERRKKMKDMKLWEKRRKNK